MGDGNVWVQAGGFGCMVMMLMMEAPTIDCKLRVDQVSHHTRAELCL